MCTDFERAATTVPYHLAFLLRLAIELAHDDLIKATHRLGDPHRGLRNGTFLVTRNEEYSDLMADALQQVFPRSFNDLCGNGAVLAGGQLWDLLGPTEVVNNYMSDYDFLWWETASRSSW